jgi:ribose/xylose/arabinose/galactoside ABC-type transport system permease subunit
MLAWETRKRRAANVHPAFLPANVFIWSLIGLTVGLLMTFKWQALRSPSVFVTLGSMVCGLAITVLSRHERSKAFQQPVTWMKTASFFVFMSGLAFLLVPILHTIGYLCFIAGGIFLGAGLLSVQATRIATNHQVKVPVRFFIESTPDMSR